MKKIVALSLIVFISLTVFAQSGKPLLKIGSKSISSEEFIRLYKKNNSNNLNEQTVDEYLELFKNFKLKVIEAENLKMDTSKAFREEFNGYKDQLAKPYLAEKMKYEAFVEEAYLRNQKEVKLDIIFVKVSVNASPEDTLNAYKKALKIHERISQGEDFEKVAIETSEDRGVEKNKGHLSFLKPIRIPYNIQNYAFSVNAKELSGPIKTDYGYYLVRLVDTRPDQGFVKVAHIMIAENDQMTVEDKKRKKEKIDSIYNSLKNGGKFEDLVNFSDDKATIKKGGELPQFSTGKMVPEFELAAFSLQNPGDYTPPVKTAFGWHIIKLIEKLPPSSPNEQKDEIRKVVETDPERRMLVKEFVTRDLMNKFNFKEVNQPKKIVTLIDSTIYKGKWGKPQNADLNTVLFELSDKKYTENALADFIANNQKNTKGKSFHDIVKQSNEEFIYQSLTECEKVELEKINPDYRYLMQEYHDGMLLFELMKKEIWDKATEDTIGLKKYYEENQSVYNNQTEFDISVFGYEDETYLASAEKLLSESRDKYNDSLIVAVVAGNNKEAFSLIENGSYTKGQNIYADIIFKMTENGTLSENQKILKREPDNVLIYINNKRISKTKPFDEIKGVVIADYQNYLEDEWMKELKMKYSIKVNKKELKKIKASFNQ
jgi:peptidyl-prolyl cis-trans isomerase SurA